MNAFTLKNKIDLGSATRIGFHKSSIIDHIMTNQSLSCNISLKDHSISDHKLIYVTINQAITENVSRTIKRKYVDVEKWR